MSHLYRSEVTFSPVSHNNGIPEVAFVVTDGNETWSMYLVRDDGAGNAAVQLFFNSTDDGVGSLISGTSTLTGVGTGAYDAGGTLAFEKEEALDEIRWITPLGTQTRSLTTFGANDDQKLRSRSIATGILRSPTNVDSSVYVDWTNFYSKRNGTNFLGAAMTSADPGTWLDPQSTVSSGGAGGPMNLDNSQGASAYRSGLTYVHATDAPRHTRTREYRVWNGGDNLAPFPYDTLIDAAIHPVSGALIWVRVPFHDQETVLFGQSTDGGVTLTESTIHNLGGALFQYPTLAVDSLGRVVAIWGDRNDTTLMYWAVSDRYGQVFDTAGSSAWPGASVEGDSSRYRYHPFSGHGVLAFRDAASTVFRGSVFEGFDSVLGPTELSTVDIHTQNTPYYGVVVVDAVGRVHHVTKDDDDDLRWWRSETYGRSWSDMGNQFDPDRFFGVVDYSDDIGLAYWANQETDGDVKANPAETMIGTKPDTTAYGPAWPVATVLSALDLLQYVGLVSGPNGILYLLYQTDSGGVYSVNCMISRDHGASWSTP